MDTITNNPFRILGLPISATDRQIAKRVDDLSMYCEMGKSKQYDTDFTFISPIERTPELIQRAASQIELPQQKLFHSIFWFWPGNSVDELVFEFLKAGNAQKARELWEKPVRDCELTAKNFPNYRNLALLNMILSVKPGNINLSVFLDALRLHLKTFNHDSFHGYLQMAGGSTCKVDLEEIHKHFADEALKVISVIDGQENPGDTAKKYIDVFKGATSGIIQHVRGKFISEPLRRLETAIVECQRLRESKKSDIHAVAKSLYSTASGILKNLERILTKQDMHYQHIADKVASEILRCSTDHYNAAIKIDGSSIPIEQSKVITLWAKELAVGSSVLAEINKDLVVIEDLKKQKAQGDKEDKIIKILKTFVEQAEDISDMGTLNKRALTQKAKNLAQFVVKGKAALRSIKKIGGTRHEGYLTLSDLVVGRVLNMSIVIANRFKSYDAALTMLRTVDDMTMSRELRQHFDRNYNTLGVNMLAQVNSGGCYIATFVYGSYEASEVLILRQFRDEVLSKSMFGKIFIRMYYTFSPGTVELLRDQIKIQKIIRQLLNKLIRKISK